MHELIEAIKAWPVIVQGALGSALFWLILLMGQKITIIATEMYSRHSKASRQSWLISAELKYEGATSSDTTIHTMNAVMLMFRSSRYLYKGIMWLVLGFAIQSIFDISGVIGFAGCIYYLLNAYAVVAPTGSGEDKEKKLEEIRKELSELNKT